MLRTPSRARQGFSLLELLVVMALIGIVLVMAVPAFGKWSADARLRVATESLVNAIRQTQATAVARGRTSLFALTTDSPPVVTSSATANASNWFSELNIMGGSDETQTTLGLILKSTEGSQNKVTINGPALICFNSAGRQTSGTPTATSLSSASCSVQSDDTTPTAYTVSRTSASRKFKVLVYLGGRVRMCDMSKTLSSTNPDGCP